MFPSCLVIEFEDCSQDSFPSVKLLSRKDHGSSACPENNPKYQRRSSKNHRPRGNLTFPSSEPITVTQLFRVFKLKYRSFRMGRRGQDFFSGCKLRLVGPNDKSETLDDSLKKYWPDQYRKSSLYTILGCSKKACSPLVSNFSVHTYWPMQRGSFPSSCLPTSPVSVRHRFWKRPCVVHSFIHSLCKSIPNKKKEEEQKNEREAKKIRAISNTSWGQTWKRAIRSEPVHRTNDQWEREIARNA